MKLNKISRHTIAFNPSPSAAAQKLIQLGIYPARSTMEVARSAYLHFVNQSALHGFDAEHWLRSEAHLLAEPKPSIWPH